MLNQNTDTDAYIVYVRVLGASLMVLIVKNLPASARVVKDMVLIPS